MKLPLLVLLSCLSISLLGQQQNEISFSYSRANTLNFNRFSPDPGLSNQYNLTYTISLTNRWSWSGGVGYSKMYSNFVYEYGIYLRGHPSNPICGIVGCVPGSMRPNDIKNEMFNFDKPDSYENKSLTYFTFKSAIRYRIFSFDRFDWFADFGFFGWHENEYQVIHNYRKSGLRRTPFLFGYNVSTAFRIRVNSFFAVDFNYGMQNFTSASEDLKGDWRQELGVGVSYLY